MQPFELFAIRYGHNGPRTLGQNIIGGDPHESHSSMDFYIWVAKRSDKAFLIDTGMAEETSRRRGDKFFRAPADALKLLDLDPEKIEDVILTHMHYDHAGDLYRYPKAQFHLQDSEMGYATGRCMCSKLMRRGYELDDVLHLVKCVYNDRVTFHDQSVEITSGLSVHRTGGHTGGQQVVRVWTERGWVVLASDASHLYYNMQNGAPFPSVHRVDEMMEGYRILYRLAEGSWDHVVPGHDPLVMQLYPAPSKELEGIVVRLDKPPRSNA
ncbi:MAG: N-acyl homoserine lactonase family protein [Mesorhizobium sp.]|nr:MAG: N-acyl homoserine lactonase family protein [Mesorhizobium sp.]